MIANNSHPRFGNWFRRVLKPPGVALKTSGISDKYFINNGMLNKMAGTSSHSRVPIQPSCVPSLQSRTPSEQARATMTHERYLRQLCDQVETVENRVTAVENEVVQTNSVIRAICAESRSRSCLGETRVQTPLFTDPSVSSTQMATVDSGAVLNLWYPVVENDSGRWMLHLIVNPDTANYTECWAPLSIGETVYISGFR